MIRRTAQTVVTIAGWSVFVLAVVYPVTAVVLAAVHDSPELAVRRTLFVRSVWLAAAGAATAIVFGLPGALVVARSGDRLRGVFRVSVLLTPVLLPAMVYAFGWDRLTKLPGEVRCIWVWASWASPVPALLIGAGWRRFGHAAYEQAMMSAGSGRAFLHAVLPLLRRHVLVAGLLLFAFFLGDYSVPHASGLVVYATELLLRSDAETASEVITGSLPVALTIAVALGAAGLLWRWATPIETDDTLTVAPVSRSLALRAIPLILVVPFVLIPLWGLARTVPVGESLAETVTTYGREVAISIGIALLSGVAAVYAGCCVVQSSRLRMAVIVWSVVWAAIPGALVGEAVVSAYLHWPIVYDHWGLMVLGYVARFGWIGVLAAWLAQSSVERDAMMAARVDGASRAQATWRIGFGANAMVLVCGVFVVAALSLSEVATTSLVRVPGVNPVSLILIEKFHRFEDGILVSLSLLMVAAAIPGAILTGIAARRWR